MHEYAGRPVGVFVRTADGIRQIVQADPFPDAKGNQVTAILLEGDARQVMASEIKGQTDEQIIARQGALYVFYPSVGWPAPNYAYPALNMALRAT